MFDWLLRVTASPYLLVVVVVCGCLFGVALIYIAKTHNSGSSGIDAAQIHHLRNSIQVQGGH